MVINSLEWFASVFARGCFFWKLKVFRALESFSKDFDFGSGISF